MATQTKALTSWQGFKNELEQREQEICSMLPGHVSRERFINSAIAAVKQTPDLLKCTPRTLFSAVTKSAQDGLLPDGREGVITKYGTDAQWNPMAFGLRKRARELDGLIVSAQVVYENDHFIWHEGDDPRIEHEPAKLGTPRGQMIGAYAIFRKGDVILHREVMDKPQIEAVKGQSKAQDGLLWTKFEAEGWRKTVVRRGFKSVPCSEKLQEVVQRDDDMFNFDVDPKPETAPPRPQRVDYTATAKEAANGPAPFTLWNAAGDQAHENMNVGNFASTLMDMVNRSEDPDEIHGLYNANADEIERALPLLEPSSRDALDDCFRARIDALTEAAEQEPQEKAGMGSAGDGSNPDPDGRAVATPADPEPQGSAQASGGETDGPAAAESPAATDPLKLPEKPTKKAVAEFFVALQKRLDGLTDERQAMDQYDYLGDALMALDRVDKEAAKRADAMIRDRAETLARE